MKDIYLEHFIEAHKNHFNNAYTELESGRKRTHWMWFIFPIAIGLGKSERWRAVLVPQEVPLTQKVH